MLIETTIFRRPVSAGAKGTYDLRIWDNRSKLPVGYAALLSWVVGIPCVTAGMAQTWWVGWVAKRIEGGKGDIGFILGFCACFIVYLPARCVVLYFLYQTRQRADSLRCWFSPHRWAERRYTGR